MVGFEKMKGSKRTVVIAIFLLIAIAWIALSFSHSGFTAGADPAITQTITVEDVTVHRGQDFFVTISLSGNENGMFSLRLLVTFDKASMRLVGYKRGTAADGFALTSASDFITAPAASGYASFGDGEHPFTLLWNSSEKMKGNGKLVTLVFRSEEDATVSDRENGTIHSLTVRSDESSTRVKAGEPCAIPVSGGEVTTLLAEHYALLLDEKGGAFALLENNSEKVTLEDAETVRAGEHPEKESDGKFSYTFRGWRETADSAPDRLVFEPIYDATPIAYEITFHQGIQVEDTVSYADARVSAFVGSEYAFGPERPVSIPYGKPIALDDYKPAANYSVHPDYAFEGWFENIFCETPVSFATMPNRNVDLYGCYKRNEESSVAASEFETKIEVVGGFVLATIFLKENRGVNGFTFAPAFDSDALVFEGFAVDADSPFVSLGSFILPAINSSLAAGDPAIGVRQDREAGYDADLLFGFESSRNVLATGKVLTLRFSIKEGLPAGVQTIGAVSSQAFSTRLKEDGSVWRAPASFKAGSFEIKRIEKPQAKAVSYSYTGSAQTFEFASPLDERYLAVTNGERIAAGVYEGEDAVVVSLCAPKDLFLTWADGRTDDLSFSFAIEKRRVALPTATTQTYVYVGSPIEYVFGSAGEPDFYSISNATRTNAGSYEGEDRVFASLLDPENTVWSDGTSDPLGFVFTIRKQLVVSPVVNAKSYNGALQTADARDDALYTVTANEGGVEKGAYPVTFTFKDGVFENYAWADSDNESVTVLFEIADAGNAWTVTPYVANKRYDGMPIEVGAAEARFGGNATVTFRNRANQSAEFSATRPVNAGIYTAEFFVAGTSSYASITERIDFEILKAELTIPTPSVLTYLYTGQAQTYVFENAGDAERYVVTNGTRTEKGAQFVSASIRDKENYVWKDGTASDKNYRFEILSRSLSALTANGEVEVFLSNALGFSTSDRLTSEIAEGTNAEWTALLSGKTPVAAAGQAPDLTGLSKKCVFLALDLALLTGGAPALSFNGAYDFEIAFPASARSGFLAAMIRGGELVVFETASSGKLSFSAGEVGRVFILADQLYSEEIAASAALKREADCEDAAVYYKSCACGAIGNEATFAFGSPLGHDYDFTAGVWSLSADRKSASVVVCCARNAAHTATFDATVTITDHAAPEKEKSGFVEFTATVLYKGIPYTDVVSVVIPSTGHVFSKDPVWTWRKSGLTYRAVAAFTCDCGESARSEDAEITATVGAAAIRYDASVLFNGEIFADSLTVDRPAAIFDFNDGVTKEKSLVFLPGASVDFPDPPARAHDSFLAWKGSDGSYIAKGESGEFFDYTIGFESVRFVAEWRAQGKVSVSVRSENGAALSGATVSLFDGEDRLASSVTGGDGAITFEGVPFGNYKLVAENPLAGAAKITRTVSLDLGAISVEKIVVLPNERLSTVVEGKGSSEGLIGAISEERKAALVGETGDLLIAQKRDGFVSESVRASFEDALRSDGVSGKFVDFYNVTVVLTITERGSLGAENSRRESVAATDGYQTNVFPISSALRAEIAKVEGTVENIFVCLRRAQASIAISYLPKVTAEEGETAEKECFFIKRVGGVDYIAIRQKEYGELGFGVGSDPVLLANEITKFALADRVFGFDPYSPNATAKYGTASIVYTYSDREDGGFSSVRPTRAGSYFVKACVPASSTYAAAEKVIAFTIAKKVVARPAADARAFVYNGQAQNYGLQTTEDYAVSGGTQTNAGKYEVVVTLADEDSIVWDNGSSAPLKYDFTIAKKKIGSIEEIAFEDKTFYFDWKKHSLRVSGEIPAGVSVVYDIEDESEIGKYIVSARFVSDDPNYDFSEPMTAVMRIRLNWAVVILLLSIVVILFVTVFVFVERLIKKMKETFEGERTADGAKTEAEGKNE